MAASRGEAAAPVAAVEAIMMEQQQQPKQLHCPLASFWAVCHDDVGLGIDAQHRAAPAWVAVVSGWRYYHENGRPHFKKKTNT